MKMNSYLRSGGLASALAMILVCILLGGCATNGGVAESPPVNPLVGSWTLSIDWYGNGGGMDHDLTVNPDLTGSLEFQNGGAADLTEVMLDGDALTFTLVLAKGSQEIKLPFEGTISEDAIEGSFNEGANPASGTRSRAEPE